MREVACPWYVERLFDRLPDIMFSIKDRDGRYVSISAPVVQRCGLQRRQDAIGRTAHEIFPHAMADRYRAQDQQLFRTGEPVQDNLDLTLYPDGSEGWCLTSKEPLLDARGAVIGLACISRDLVELSAAGLIDDAFADSIDHLLGNHGQAIRMEELAARAGLTSAQFNRRMKKIFHLPGNQYLMKLRIDHACRLLMEPALSIAEVALRSGFADQSALSRAFRQTLGCSPRQHREQQRALPIASRSGWMSRLQAATDA